MQTSRTHRSVAVTALATVLALSSAACEEDGGIEDSVEQEVQEDIENVEENVEEETDGQSDE